MASQSQWPIVPMRTTDGPERMFFTSAEWNTVEAATARIIPTDHDPGAREAGVVHFLDRFLSGIDYIYVSADGSGFLQMSGKDAEAWHERIAHRQQVYRDGIAELERLSRNRTGKGFTELDDATQDDILEELSGRPRPQSVSLHARAGELGAGGPPPTNQPVSDEGLPFFDMLVLHTRQGFYADPAYGGNKDRIGWRVIGYPGPESLADTVEGRYTTTDYMLMDATWPYANHPSVQRYGRRSR
ncbi:gluconate 2-dehydrogenase subunit 3 family protein [Pseudonocardia sp. H11422]|uniref:gluconate 2-dehydrogenase subunit 3 family protein n=1 Tax=Pseudonocardia sp. H11422 TaxID=2835866 RepID=UPI001BDDA707|nr:gluconate 2-dehydrogenase subunit 3 family protein [Pseudonocardia sp. H11422]